MDPSAAVVVVDHFQNVRTLSTSGWRSRAHSRIVVGMKLSNAATALNTRFTVQSETGEAVVTIVIPPRPWPSADRSAPNLG